MQPERGREQRIVERHEFQAIRVVAPRRGKGTVVARLTRQIALDGQRTPLTTGGGGVIMD